MLRKALMGLTLVFLSTVLMAEDSEPPVETSRVHWALSSFLGTGWYKVDASRSVFAIRIPPRQIVRESWFNSREDREVGIEIKYDTTVGLDLVRWHQEPLPVSRQPEQARHYWEYLLRWLQRF